MENQINESIALATTAIAFFGIFSCLMHKRFRWVSIRFSVFLFAVILNNIGTTIASFHNQISFGFQVLLEVVWLLGLVSLAPTFWAYVHALTSRKQIRLPYLRVHLIVPGIAFLACIGALILFDPSQTEEQFLQNGPTATLSLLLGLLLLLLPLQLVIYIFLFLRRLVVYRRRLRDVYASTSAYELRWVLVIGSVALLFWILTTIDLFSIFGSAWTPPHHSLSNFVGFVLFFTTVLWGMRQRPALIPTSAEDNQSSKNLTKYSKSALTESVAKRISKKLTKAMEVDKCYQNPNLSLWLLSKHIGTTPNYISQTLNEALRLNFFDFVNGYRIEEAKQQLRKTDRSILNIAYDVGFNTKSSFYSSFKRISGDTPSAYRKKNVQS